MAVRSATTYRFGDSTPCGFDVDYLEVLPLLLRAGVAALAAEGETAAARRRQQVLRRQAEAETAELEAIAQTVHVALDPVSRSPRDTVVTRCANAVDRAAADVVRSRVDEVRGAVDEKLAGLDRRIAEIERDCRQALAPLLVHFEHLAVAGTNLDEPEHAASVVERIVHAIARDVLEIARRSVAKDALALQVVIDGDVQVRTLPLSQLRDVVSSQPAAKSLFSPLRLFGGPPPPPPPASSGPEPSAPSIEIGIPAGDED